MPKLPRRSVRHYPKFSVRERFEWARACELLSSSGDLDNGIFEQLGRYEAAVWRQVRFPRCSICNGGAPGRRPSTIAGQVHRRCGIGVELAVLGSMQHDIDANGIEWKDDQTVFGLLQNTSL